MCILNKFFAMCEVYARVTKRGVGVRDVTKHGDRCLSPASANWVRDGAGIDFADVYGCEKCSLFIQSRVASNSKVLRKKRIDLVSIRCFRPPHKLETLCMDTEKFWMTITYMCSYLLILHRGS